MATAGSCASAHSTSCAPGVRRRSTVAPCVSQQCGVRLGRVGRQVEIVLRGLDEQPAHSGRKRDEVSRVVRRLDGRIVAEDAIRIIDGEVPGERDDLPIQIGMPEREHRRSETAHRESAYRPKPPRARVRSLHGGDQRAGDEGLHLAAAVDGVGPLGVVEVVVVAVRASNHEGLDAGGEGGGKGVAGRWVAQIACSARLAMQQVDAPAVGLVERRPAYRRGLPGDRRSQRSPVPESSSSCHLPSPMSRTLCWGLADSTPSPDARYN